MVLLQLFLRGNPFQGSEAFKEPWINVALQLQRDKRLAGLVVYGSFYLWKNFIEVLESSLPVAFSPGQMPLAQEITLQSLFKTDNKEETFSNLSLEEFTN